MCSPTGSEAKLAGELQRLKPPPSRAHSKAESASLETKPKLAEAESTVPDGPAVIVVSGATVSSAVGCQLSLTSPWAPLSGISQSSKPSTAIA
jgi:hypothetical protein